MDGGKSTLEFGVGNMLEEQYYFEYQERVPLDVRGTPR
ncbi:hypothetical protein HALLA_20940 (plasmid) [Halostagnicola larsenii XH-48]|uniref:Uncharacterized protein n=1 Tax=Halostagnicola larsenii XH-48 TaxID=797299 RepID=W0JZK1_9EURY|nr:hypothetical protein HALLA_20940 [Halostagnicola larsenii XH-48]